MSKLPRLILKSICISGAALGLFVSEERYPGFKTTIRLQMLAESCKVVGQ